MTIQRSKQQEEVNKRKNIHVHIESLNSYSDGLYWESYIRNHCIYKML